MTYEKELVYDEFIKIGTKIRLNANNGVMEVVEIQHDNTVAIVVLRDCATGRKFPYGLEALKRCNVTILQQP